MKTVKVYEVGGKIFKDKKSAEKEEKELAKKEHLKYLTKKRDQALESLKGWEKAIAEAGGKPDYSKLFNMDPPDPRGEIKEHYGLSTPKLKECPRGLESNQQ